jgi:hypothetical protein
VNELIEEFIKTKMAWEEAHEISSKADAAHKAVKAQLVEAMQDEDTAQKEHASTGLRFDLRPVWSIACNKDNEQELSDWLHERYGDIEEFTEPKLSKKTISRRLRTDIENEELDEFDVPDFVNLKNRPDVWCMGWKQYRDERMNEDD